MITIYQLIQVLPVAVGAGGFFLAFYIFTKKRRKEKMVCPLDSDCDAVVHSQYSTFLGIPLELLGMIYFASISFSFIFALFIPKLNSTYFVILMPAVTLGAFLFSIYLVIVQLLLIKEWRAWCLISTILCTMEFSIVLTISPLNVRGLLSAFLNI